MVKVRFNDQPIQVRVDGAALASRQAALAENAADRAQDAADFAEGFTGPVYASVGAGEAATTPGQIFRVSNGDGPPETTTVYRRTSGGSVVQAPLATTAALASTDAGKGAGMVGFKQSGTGMSDQTALTILRRTGVWLDDHPDADSTGASDSKAAFDATIASAATDGRALILPQGEFHLSAVSLPTTGEIIIEGKGEDSQLIVNAANQAHLLSLVSGGRLRLYNFRLVGDGTATSSSNGRGLFIADTSDVDLDSLIFQNFGFAGLLARNTSIDQVGERLNMRNLRALDGVNPTRGYIGQITLWSGWRKVTGYNLIVEGALGSAAVHDNATVTNAINPPTDTFFDGVIVHDTTAANALGVLDPPANYNSEVVLDVVRVSGGAGRGVSVGTEYANPSDNADFKLSNISAHNTGCAAVKVKYVHKVQIDGVYAKGCDRHGGEQPISTLSGTILLNGLDSSTVSNVVLEDCGQEGVTLMGTWTGDSSGVGRGRHVHNGVIVNGSGLYAGGANPGDLVTSGAALYIPYNIYDAVFNGLVANDVKEGVFVRALQDAGGTADPPKRLVFNSPIIQRTSAQTGMRFLGDASRLIGPVFINSPIISDTATQNISFQYVSYAEINGGRMTGAGTVGVGRAVSVIDTSHFKMNGTTVATPNNTGTAGTFFPLFFSGTNALAELYNSNLSGGSGNIQFSTTPTEFRFDNNKGILDGRGVSTIAGGGNADATVSWASHGTVMRAPTTMTADRSITLPAGLFNGMTVKVLRPSTGAFNLNIVWDSSTIKAMATATWAEFKWDGADWIVSGAGAL